MKRHTTHARKVVGALLATLFLLIGGMKAVLFWEAFLQSGYGPSLLHLFLRFADKTGVLGAIGGLIVAPALALVVLGSLLAFAAYDHPASVLPNKFI